MKRLAPVFIFCSILLTACASAAPGATPTPGSTPAPRPASSATPTLAWTVCVPRPGIKELACTSAASGLRYWLYQPGGTPGPAKLPLLVYLHGAGDAGDDLTRVLSGGVPDQIERKQRALPMIVISPQAPAGDFWPSSGMVERVSRLVAETVANYGADPQRVYLTGFSMGGDGALALGMAHPEQFAALAPIAGWYQDTRALCNLRAVPVRAYQGEVDTIAPLAGGERLVAALQFCGGQVQLQVVKGAPHEVVSGMVYGDDELYTWLLEQRRD